MPLAQITNELTFTPELTYCGAYPWSCTPLLIQMVKGFLPLILIGLIVILFLSVIIFLVGRIIKKPISVKKIILICFSFVPIIVILLIIRLVVLAGPLSISNRDTINCILRNAPSVCYENAAITTISASKSMDSLKICNLTTSSSQCKVNVCENLSSGDTNNNVLIEKTCKDLVINTCQNGYILDNIPCACDVPAGPYAVYDEKWLHDYWNKYRKGDTFSYCCNGRQQDKSCTE